MQNKQNKSKSEEIMGAFIVIFIVGWFILSSYFNKSDTDRYERSSRSDNSSEQSDALNALLNGRRATEQKAWTDKQIEKLKR